MDIALLEDDPAQLGLFQRLLEHGGHCCQGFETQQAFAKGLQQRAFDLLVIDWMLPDGRGDLVIDMIRREFALTVPIMVLTAVDDEATVVRALQAGADDYIVKPPRPLALVARAEALVRRSRVQAPTAWRSGAYEIDLPGRTIFLREKLVELTQKEFDLAVLLFLNPGKLFSRMALLEQVWGIQVDLDTRTVDTHVSRLRRKLEIEPGNGFKLTPIYGFGYRLERIEAASAAKAA